MLLYTSVLCLVVLLASNVWLLKEVERLRRQVSACREAVSTLDDRLFQLAIAVDELTRPAPALPQGFERSLE